MNALLITAQGATKVCTENSRIHQQGVCGRAIPRLLSALCGKGGYNNKQYKRSEAPPLDTLDSSLAGMCFLFWPRRKHHRGSSPGF